MGKLFKGMLLNAGAVALEINEILHGWVGPLFTAIGGVGCIYIIVLAVQYMKSENDNKRAEVKTRIINCLIGVISLLVIGTISLTMDWAGLAGIFGYASN